MSIRGAQGTSFLSFFSKGRILFERAKRGEQLLWGRKPECDIQIDSGFISGRHGYLRFDSQSLNWQIADAGSTNGTKVNGALLPKGEWREIKTGDTIEIFSLLFRFDLPDLSQANFSPPAPPVISPPIEPVMTKPFKGEGGFLTWPSVPVGQMITVGRQGEWKLNDPTVSRVHAQLRNRSGVYEVYDLGSSNGTYLTNEQFTEERLPPQSWVELELGDVVRFGKVEVIVGEAPR
jgi:pSer/pThr/pTyr-binding forkhead associated (FHA) protein